MAGITRTFVTQVKDDAGRVLGSATVSKTADGEIEFDVTVPGSGNYQVDLPIDVSNCVAWYMVSDKIVTMTENVGPDLTKVLAAGVTWFWHNDMGANPFTVDVIYLKFTKADATDANVKGAFIVSA
jgi:hypothetical protein